MSFSERAKITALAIVKIFETSKPVGDYSAVAVLNDGAGLSVGISQFTHKSGSLSKVLVRFVDLGGVLPTVVADAIGDFKSGRNIPKHSKNASLKVALRRLGKTSEMQQAQREIAFECYLKPSIEACEGSGFVLPLSLAVVYDSINHGSYAKIRDRVRVAVGGEMSEREWIAQYVGKRDEWLESIPRLAATDYRTDFFLAQIARNNWQLALPMNVHGVKLTEAVLFPTSSATVDTPELSTPLDNQPSPPDTSADLQASPLDSKEGQSPIQQSGTVEKTVVEQTDAGTVESTTTTQSPNVAVEKEAKPVGFFEGIKLKIAGWWGTLGGTEGARKFAEDSQFLGLDGDTWRLLTYIVLGIGAVGFIGYTVKHLWTQYIGPRLLTNSLIVANSTPTNSVLAVSPENIAEYEKRGWIVVRRA